MNKLLAVTSITLISCMATIAQADVFVGGLYGVSSSDIENAKIDDNVRNRDFSDSLKGAETWGFRAGGDFEFMRVYGTYDHAAKKDSTGRNTQENFLLSTDFMYRVENNVRLFAGVTAGVSRLDNDGATYYGKTHDAYSYVYGAQLGMTYDFANWELEGGYRYLIHEGYDRDGNSDADYFPSVKRSDQAYMALNYHF